MTPAVRSYGKGFCSQSSTSSAWNKKMRPILALLTVLGVTAAEDHRPWSLNLHLGIAQMQAGEYFEAAVSLGRAAAQGADDDRIEEALLRLENAARKGSTTQL